MRNEKTVRTGNLTLKLDAIESLSHRVLEKAAELVFILDDSGKVVYINNVWAEGLGKDINSVTRRKFAEFVHEDDQESFSASFASLLRERKVDKNRTFRLQRADGTWRFFHASLVPQMDTEGNLICISGIARDVTDEIEIEHMKEEFLSVVSHELRNPLTSVKGYISLMRRKGSYDESMLDMALAQTAVLQRLINDLLDLSRLQTGRLTLNKGYVFLPELARDVIKQMVSVSSLHQLEIKIDPEFPGFQGDPVRLSQALTNLVSNAIKYSPRGGKVTVSLTYTPGDVSVSVSDEGLGISAEKLPKVWARFYQGEQTHSSSYQGLGLGLHVVKAIVEAHGGRVWAESEEGKGSTFGFTLPLADYTQQGESGILI